MARHDDTFGPVPGDEGVVLTVKNLAQELLDAIVAGFADAGPLTGAQERARACAKTRLEESIMWACRGLRKGWNVRI